MAISSSYEAEMARTLQQLGSDRNLISREHDLTRAFGLRRGRTSEQLRREEQIETRRNPPSILEKPTRKILFEDGVDFLFEKCKFDLTPNGHHIDHTKIDVVTNRSINDGRWVIECKGERVLRENPKALLKLAMFMARYGRDYHLTLITNMSKEDLEQLKRTQGLEGVPIAHEIIHIDFATVRGVQVEHPNRSYRSCMNLLLAEKLRELERFSKAIPSIDERAYTADN